MILLMMMLLVVAGRAGRRWRGSSAARLMLRMLRVELMNVMKGMMVVDRLVMMAATVNRVIHRVIVHAMMEGRAVAGRGVRAVRRAVRRRGTVRVSRAH